MINKEQIIMNSYINVKNEIKANTGADLSEQLQILIDNNPNRTIFFPDGEYELSKPIMTSAKPEKSVLLLLSNYAHIKASDDWNSSEALIRIGGKEPENDNFSVGSNYGIEGGIIDGNGVANGISIDSGRESFIRNVSIKNTKIGIHIKYGANSGSSDSDISGVNITGNGKKNSIGILVEGFDNTFTNMRIANVFIGVKLDSSGNMLRNIHPLYILKSSEMQDDYDDSIGFWDIKGNNFCDFCYSDQFATGFVTEGEISSIYHNCWCFWYSDKGDIHKGFEANGEFNSLVTNFKLGFKSELSKNIVLSEKSESGHGVMQNICVQKELLADSYYEKYLQGKII